MELPDVIDQQIETLSKGMAQKVQFVAAVISQPALLILDEPFSGLDPVNAAGAQGRGARDPAARHHGRLQHARHGHRREDVRPHLHDLQAARRCSTARCDEIQAQYGVDTVRIRTAGGASTSWPACPAWKSVNDFGQVQEVRADRRPAGSSSQQLDRAHRRAPLRGHAAVAARHLRPHRAPRRGGGRLTCATHPDRRLGRVRHARPEQGVRHHAAADAGHHGGLGSAGPRLAERDRHDAAPLRLPRPERLRRAGPRGGCRRAQRRLDRPGGRRVRPGRGVAGRPAARRAAARAVGPRPAHGAVRVRRDPGGRRWTRLGQRPTCATTRTIRPTATCRSGSG